jgi:hypothetical protein
VNPVFKSVENTAVQLSLGLLSGSLVDTYTSLSPAKHGLSYRADPGSLENGLIFTGAASCSSWAMRRLPTTAPSAWKFTYA